MNKKIVITASFAESLINFRGDLLKAFVKEGYDVIACAPAPDDQTVISRLSELGVVFKAIPLNRTGLNLVKDFKTVMALKKVFREENPDIVLSYTIKPVVYGSLAAKFAGVKSINSMITGLGYAFIETSFKGKVINFIAANLYRLGLSFNKTIFFQNPDDRDLFLEKSIISTPAKCQTVNGSGVDIDYFAEQELPQETSFLLIARLLKDKGICEYVEAARLIKQKYPEVSFKLVGWLDSNPASISQDDLDEWREEGIVEYLGKLDDVRAAIKDCSVYVLPSYREGTPRTVLEAISMGRAVITTDVPGCRETVNDEVNGYLVPVKDSTRLADAMEKFIEGPTLIEQMGKKSRSIAVEKYDVHKVNKVILKRLLAID